MSTSPITRRRTLVGGLLAALVALTGTLLFALPASSAASSRHPAPKPTVVLVHGAFADASGWSGVVSRLQKRGYPVIAPANPLRSVAGDSAYLGSVLASIDGPIVLVGHSYGGEVITNAATGNANVKALVYIAAFAPDQDETSGGLANRFPGTGLTPENLVFRPYPGGTDGYINPAVFHAVFCADLPTKTADAMAAEQRPGSRATLGEPSGPPAWKTIPSWYLVANQDQAIPAAAERFMADRMGAHTVEIDSSHVAMISHPDVVAQLITSAADATG